MQWLMLFFIMKPIIANHEGTNLLEFLQPDVILDEDVETGRHSNNNNCYRTCLQDGPPRICYYRLVIESYHTLGAACGGCPLNKTACYNSQCVTADGYERGILTVNRRMPGPSIQVCRGDRIIADVKNLMPARSTGVHWHGIFQNGTPYMDGVPMITQCPINEGQIFRYDFEAGNIGTHFWHAHDGFQKMDGLVGSLVIREPSSNDPNSHLYDYDLPSHVMLITDWYHLDADQHFPGLRTHNQGQNPDTLLVNGRGRYLQQVNEFRQFLGSTPFSVFRVAHGRRYRFRLVGGTCTVCPVQLSVQSHNLLVIAADGTAIQPVRVDAIVLYTGERYDVVLEATENISSYWIHVKGLGACTLDEVYQVAILRYIGDENTEPLSSIPPYEGFVYSNVIFNPWKGICGNSVDHVCVSSLKSIYPVDPAVLQPLPDFHLELGYGFYKFTAKELFDSGRYLRYFQPPAPVILTSTVNNITNIFPPSPLISQVEDIPHNLFCVEGDAGYSKCARKYCECLHIIKIPLGAIVQILLVDKAESLGVLNHPFHLHGHAFHILAVDQFRNGQTLNKLRAELKAGLLIPHSLQPVEKDTIAVPSTGYAVIRFRANNPGYWLFHCHFLYHLATGMSVILQVGDHTTLPQAPCGFPRCGDFLPQEQLWSTRST